MNIQGKPQWEFCCEWYSDDEIESAIARDRNPLFQEPLSAPSIPFDVQSREFAEWLARQYRLAMNRGIELAENEFEKCHKCGEETDTVKQLEQEVGRLKALIISIGQESLGKGTQP